MSAANSKTLLFIHSCVDDAGLTPAEFRVLCRIARRGNCCESVANMAIGCRLAPGTVKKALRSLVGRKIVSKEKRFGETSIHKIVPFSHWQIQPGPNGYLGQTDAQLLEQPACQAKRHPTPLGQTDTHKGNPIKVIQKRGKSSPRSFESKPLIKKREMWQLINDSEKFEKKIQKEKEKNKPDPAILAALRAELKSTNDEIRAHGDASQPGQDAASVSNPNTPAPVQLTPAPHPSQYLKQGPELVERARRAFDEAKKKFAASP